MFVTTEPMLTAADIAGYTRGELEFMVLAADQVIWALAAQKDTLLRVVADLNAQAEAQAAELDTLHLAADYAEEVYGVTLQELIAEANEAYYGTAPDDDCGYYPSGSWDLYPAEAWDSAEAPF